MGVIGIIWSVVIALKLFTSLVATSWWIVLFWPLVPLAMIVLFLFMVFFLKTLVG